MATLKERINYVKANYNENNHYDLAMSLCCDLFTDDADDLKAVVNGVFNHVNNEEIQAAIDDYNE